MFYIPASAYCGLVQFANNFSPISSADCKVLPDELMVLVEQIALVDYLFIAGGAAY